ncbi:acyl-CoA dehydrogenase family protein [Streptomyces sp. H10-C2]|uniref:acyl-CoA dehydrogenase family protein n=1 Tax=unclassified Streptomyces TaxID=2593676 RepID=UPI0024B9A780|nr:MULTISPECIES: acyl-CoA dehydrogenase family protein [unclassified Streptomyces]MDJ0341854.1 acyl-CoA dehydrogenase family protein [Streptomyces sp. PH10-H1]MDJ0370392.1 acyl-CoA dehydrogenase family protein [Streptomyces sp. H10-C2]
MRFLLDAEQTEFTRTLDRLLTAADTPAAVRAWSAGDHGPGRALWERLAATGVFALAVSEEYEGLGPLPVELAAAFVELGRHAVPGPLAETVAVSVLLQRLGDRGPAKEWLPRIASGRAMVTLALSGPYALDADAADAVFHVVDDDLVLADGHGPVRTSLDPARRLARPTGGESVAHGPAVREAADWAAFATAAQALGVGLALAERTVAYAKQRTQFGTAIGAFQAVKHQLADAVIGLEFGRPLLYGAAVALAAGAPDASRNIAAAKVACGESAYAAARTALQLHGAIGYTAEYDLSLWIGKATALRTAWGTPSECRARVLSA